MQQLTLEPFRVTIEAADIKRVLEARIKEADDPNTVWIGHDELFDHLEASLAS